MVPILIVALDHHLNIEAEGNVRFAEIALRMPTLLFFCYATRTSDGGTACSINTDERPGKM
jgi:hypothetical protein